MATAGLRLDGLKADQTGPFTVFLTASRLVATTVPGWPPRYILGSTLQALPYGAQGQQGPASPVTHVTVHVVAQSVVVSR
jgi:hypothetical protein